MWWHTEWVKSISLLYCPSEIVFIWKAVFVNHLNKNGPASDIEKEVVNREINGIVNLLNGARVPYLIIYHVEGDSKIQFVHSANNYRDQMKTVGYFLGSDVEHSYIY